MSEDDMRRLVLEALGEVSMCWSETPKGVFQVIEAVRIGDDLMKAIKEYKTQQESDNAKTPRS